MWMPPHQLAIQMPEHIDDRKIAGLITHLRIKQHLQQQIPQFFGQVHPVLPLDGVQHLVGLFQGVFADRSKALLAIPWAAPRSAESRHDRNALLKQCAGLGWLAAVLLVHASPLTEVRPPTFVTDRSPSLPRAPAAIRPAILPSEPSFRATKSDW